MQKKWNLKVSSLWKHGRKGSEGSRVKQHRSSFELSSQLHYEEPLNRKQGRSKKNENKENLLCLVNSSVTSETGQLTAMIIARNCIDPVSFSNTMTVQRDQPRFPWAITGIHLGGEEGGGINVSERLRMAFIVGNPRCIQLRGFVFSTNLKLLTLLQPKACCNFHRCIPLLSYVLP